jgi:hypothetical protein
MITINVEGQTANSVQNSTKNVKVKNLLRIQGWDSQSIFSSYLKIGKNSTKIRRKKCFVNPSPRIHATRCSIRIFIFPPGEVSAN